MTAKPSIHDRLSAMFDKVGRYLGEQAKGDGEHKKLFAQLAIKAHTVYTIPGEFTDAKQKLAKDLLTALKTEAQNHPDVPEFKALGNAVSKIEPALSSLPDQGIAIVRGKRPGPSA